MNDIYTEALKRLDDQYPGVETLTLDQAAKLLQIALKTLRNQASITRCPFPVLKVGGKVLVSKIIMARVLCGMPMPNPDELLQLKKKPGRPKNSDGLARFAWNRLNAIWDAMEREERAILESVCPPDLPPRLPRRIGDIRL